MSVNESVAIFGHTLARDLVRVSRDPGEITNGWWAVVQTFEGEFFGFQFNAITDDADNFLDSHATDFCVKEESWRSSLSQIDYEAGVTRIREHIAHGWVYQTNFCRVLYAQLEGEFDSCALLRRIQTENPAPFASALHIPAIESGLNFDIRVASASPELFLQRVGDRIVSSPIKGTAVREDLMLEKDQAENVMIVDLIRNDLSHVCIPGTVTVPDLLRIENHPGLSHLVSDVAGVLNLGTTWSDILLAMMPPGSVSGAPKHSALSVISELEPVNRQIYCGTIGWIDADANTAQLSVAIRTFWQDFENPNTICFGTGAGITYSSDPTGEWLETELKASHLLKVAANTNR